MYCNAIVYVFICLQIVNTTECPRSSSSAPLINAVRTLNSGQVLPQPVRRVIKRPAVCLIYHLSVRNAALVAAHAFYNLPNTFARSGDIARERTPPARPD